MFHTDKKNVVKLNYQYKANKQTKLKQFAYYDPKLGVQFSIQYIRGFFLVQQCSVICHIV
jgi:hypothetical protein